MISHLQQKQHIYLLAVGVVALRLLLLPSSGVGDRHAKAAGARACTSEI
jgi:hypothetical protein